MKSRKITTDKPKAISDKALKVIDSSITNLKKGKMSATIDLSDF